MISGKNKARPQCNSPKNSSDDQQMNYPTNSKLIPAYTKEGHLISVRVPCNQQESDANAKETAMDSNLKAQTLVPETADVDANEQIVAGDRDISSDLSNDMDLQTLVAEPTAAEIQNLENPGHHNPNNSPKSNIRYFIIF